MRFQLNRYQQGVTLIEILVGIILTSLLIASALEMSIINKKAVRLDSARTSINQTLRSGLSLIGNDIRLAGEGLTGEVPAIEIFKAISPFQLVVRKRVFPWTFSLCDPISTGGSLQNVIISTNDPASMGTSCSYDGNKDIFSKINSFVDKWSGSPLALFIFDSNTRRGDLVPFSQTNDRMNSHVLKAAGGFSASRDYPLETTRVFFLEEWSYRVKDSALQLIVNQNENEPISIVESINQFSPKAVIGADELDEYNINSPSYDWTSLRLVQITLTGKSSTQSGGINPFSQKPIVRTVQGEFFPRNILSAKN